MERGKKEEEGYGDGRGKGVERGKKEEEGYGDGRGKGVDGRKKEEKDRKKRELVVPVKDKGGRNITTVSFYLIFIPCTSSFIYTCDLSFRYHVARLLSTKVDNKANGAGCAEA